MQWLTVSSGCSLIRNLRRLKQSLRIFAHENELIFFMLPWHTKMPEWATARSRGTPSWSYANKQSFLNHYHYFHRQYSIIHVLKLSQEPKLECKLKQLCAELPTLWSIISHKKKQNSSVLLSSTKMLHLPIKRPIFLGGFSSMKNQLMKLVNTADVID